MNRIIVYQKVKSIEDYIITLFFVPKNALNVPVFVTKNALIINSGLEHIGLAIELEKLLNIPVNIIIDSRVNGKAPIELKDKLTDIALINSPGKTVCVNVKVAYIRPRYKNLTEWIRDPNNVYIGRGRVLIIDGLRYPSTDSIWANTFKVGKDGTRAEVIKMYENNLRSKIDRGEITRDMILSLKSKTLGCWCVSKPRDEMSSEPECHGEVLLKLIKEFEGN